MKTYHVVYTHNPQEFFDGIEPEDLTEDHTVPSDNLMEIFDMVDAGYKAIIFPGGDDGCRN